MEMKGTNKNNTTADCFELIVGHVEEYCVHTSTHVCHFCQYCNHHQGNHTAKEMSSRNKSRANTRQSQVEDESSLRASLGSYASCSMFPSRCNYISLADFTKIRLPVIPGLPRYMQNMSAFRGGLASLASSIESGQSQRWPCHACLAGIAQISWQSVIWARQPKLARRVVQAVLIDMRICNSHKRSWTTTTQP